MVGSRYRTRQEMIEYFKTLSHGFRKDAWEMSKLGLIGPMNVAYGKADAYEMAAFELEHNMED